MLSDYVVQKLHGLQRNINITQAVGSISFKGDYYLQTDLFHYQVCSNIVNSFEGSRLK